MRLTLRREKYARVPTIRASRYERNET